MVHLHYGDRLYYLSGKVIFSSTLITIKVGHTLLKKMSHRQSNLRQCVHQSAPVAIGTNTSSSNTAVAATSNSMIRCTFVVVLAILLLIIAVSGFFILLISNDCNIFYPYAQTLQLSPSGEATSANKPTALHPNHHLLGSTPNDSFFYTSTLCQLTLILFEVMVALVIIFHNEVASDSTSLYSNYNLVSCTPHHSYTSSVRLEQRRCPLIFSLKLIFILLISVSFLLRLVTSTWSSILLVSPNQALPYSSWSNSAPSSSATSYVAKVIDAIITGASNFSGIIYVTSIIEVLLFVLVLSASTRISAPLRLHK